MGLMKLFWPAVAIVAVASAISMAAQTTAPTFRSAVRLVKVDVVVHDKAGSPVRDLTKADFTVFERGQPQQVAFFSEHMADAATGAPEPLPPHVFTNVAVQRPGTPTNATAILLDTLNTSWADQHRARDALVSFLSQIEPQDRIAIYVLSQHGLMLLHDYTTDATGLVARLKAANGDVSADLNASMLDPDTQQDLRDLGLGSVADSDQIEADFFTSGRVADTLAAFDAIAQHLAGLPGRKSLVWLSAGIPLMIGFDQMPQPGSTRVPRSFTADMDAVIRALNSADIAVYPVDARGLMGFAGYSAQDLGFSRRRSTPEPTGPAVGAEDTAMEDLASRTGGRAAFNTNELGRAIRNAIDDGRVIYEIGYYPSDDAQDGRFREIRVIVDRPQLDVRYRKGYFALRPADKNADARRERMREAVWSPFESTALPIGLRVDLLDRPQSNTINILIKLEPSTIAFRRESGRWKADLDLACAQKNDRGGLEGHGTAATLALDLTDDDFARMQKEGLVQQMRVVREPNATTVRVVVRDQETGALGSVTFPFNAVIAAGR